MRVIANATKETIAHTVTSMEELNLVEFTTDLMGADIKKARSLKNN